MKIAINILQKVLVNHFYKVNAGFFVFVFFVLTAPHDIVPFHLTIIKIITQSQSFLAGVMVIWLLYNFKCMDYVLKQLRAPQQLFLFCLNNLSPQACFVMLVYAQVLVYMPVFAYAGIVAGVAVKTHYYACFIQVIVFNIALVLLTAAVYLRALQKRPLFTTSIALPQIRLGLSKPLFSIPLYYLVHNRKQMLLVTKVFSLVLLFGFIQLYEPDHYDMRPLLLCFMLVVAANSSIVFQLKTFEDEHMFITKNFPLPIAKRFANVLLMYAVLMLPELLFVWKGYPIHFHIAGYIEVVLMGVSMLSLFHASLYTDDMDMEAYIKIVFGVMATLFFVLLYDPGILLFCLLLAIAFGLYASYYYDFEKKYDQ